MTQPPYNLALNWNEHDIAELIRHRAEGVLTNEEIAEAIGKSYATVASFIKKNHLPRRASSRNAQKPNPERKTRTCLRCRGPFTSEWAGNRLCPRCGDYAGRMGPAVDQPHGFRTR